MTHVCESPKQPQTNIQLKLEEGEENKNETTQRQTKVMKADSVFPPKKAWSPNTNKKKNTASQKASVRLKEGMSKEPHRTKHRSKNLFSIESAARRVWGVVGQEVSESKRRQENKKG